MPLFGIEIRKLMLCKIEKTILHMYVSWAILKKVNISIFYILYSFIPLSYSPLQKEFFVTLLTSFNLITLTSPFCSQLMSSMAKPITVA